MANDVQSDVVVKYQSVGADQVNDDLKKTGQGLDDVSVKGGNAEKVTLSVTNAFKALERQLGTTEGNAQKFAKVQEIANKMVAQNPEAQGRANELVAAAAVRYGQLEQVTNNLANAHKGLDAYGQSAMHSMRSLVEQIAMGVPITQALASQFSHLSFQASGEGGIVGAFRQVGTMIAGFATPLNVAMAGVAGLTAAVALLAQKWADVQHNAEMAISNAGARTGTTVSDLNKFASQQSMPGGITETEARKLGEDMTKTGEIVISQLHGMGMAVQGFANITHTSVADARKAWVSFAQDPQKALDELAKTYGDFSKSTKIVVDQLVQAGDKTGALNVITDELAQKNLKATEATTMLSKAYEGWLYLLGKQAIKPTGIEEEIAKVKQQLNEVIELAPKLEGAYQLQGASDKIAALSRKLEDLQAAQQKVLAQNMAAEMNHLATEAEKATAALVPEVAQIEQLKQKIADLNRAKEAGVTSKYGGAADAAALTIAQDMQHTAEETLAVKGRQAAVDEQLRQKYQGMSLDTAKQLEAMQNMLPVAEAVGGAAKIQAQYHADIKNYILAGKSAEEAAALAAANRAQAEAQVESAAKETLWQLQNQAQVAAAVTGAAQMAAQAEATKNQLMHDGVSALTAQAVAAQQLANAEAQATANVQRQVYSLEQSTRMIYAQMNGTEATEAASQAYDNAMRSGASSAAAAALSSATLANYTAKAAASAAQMAQSYLAVGQASVMFGSNVFGAYQGANSFGGSVQPMIRLANGQFVPANTAEQFKLAAEQQKYGYDLGAMSAANNPSLADYIDTVIRSGGLQAGLRTAMALPAVGKGGTYAESDIESEVASLYQTLNQNADKATQISNTQAELQWLQGRPASAAQQSQIAQLRQSLDNLTKSTDSLNATNQDLLSPYYTQDPRTSHIGFRSQGMATGGYVDVPGSISANDNMIATVPVSSGERIYVDPMYSRRGISGGANFTINISSPVLFAGNPNKDEVGRTMYQNNQNLAKQLRSAMQ